MDTPPQTIPAAVQWLKENIGPEALDRVRGLRTPAETSELHFNLAVWIRNEFGLWGQNDRLHAECGTNHADDASSVIVRALWEDLQRTSTPEELAAARTRRDVVLAEREKVNHERLAMLAAREMAITPNQCPACGKPRLSYRKSCKYCSIKFV